jgi:hypothetical protein
MPRRRRELFLLSLLERGSEGPKEAGRRLAASPLLDAPLKITCSGPRCKVRISSPPNSGFGEPFGLGGRQHLDKSRFLGFEQLQLFAKAGELLWGRGSHEALSLLDTCPDAGNPVSEIRFPTIFAHELAPSATRMAAIPECVLEQNDGKSAWSYDIVEAVTDAGDYKDFVTECKTKPRNGGGLRCDRRAE